MKYYLLFILCLGCQRTEYEDQTDKQYDFDAANQIINNDIFYIKDKKTNLCFAAYHPYWNNAFFTNVPCTEDVEKKIINK